MDGLGKRRSHDIRRRMPGSRVTRCSEDAGEDGLKGGERRSGVAWCLVLLVVAKTAEEQQQHARADDPDRTNLTDVQPQLQVRSPSTTDQMTCYAPNAMRRFAAHHQESDLAQLFAVTSGI